MAAYTANAPPPLYTSPPMYAAPIPQFVSAPEVHLIRDWLPWSIISLIIGWGLGGIIPLIFSIICRSNKRRNDVQGARLMGNLALIFNILITIGGIAGWIGFIIWIVWYVRFINELHSI
jgi:hypothetical protein